MKHIAGIVLCGGASRRMGRDKALLPWRGRPLLAHVVDVVGRVCQPVVVAASAGQELPPLPPATIVSRDAAYRQGPLHGICAAMDALPREVEGVFLTGCDYPHISESVIRFLSERFDQYRAIIIPQVGGVAQPLIALYPTAVHGLAVGLVARGEASLRAILENHPWQSIAESDLRSVDPDLASFRCVNTPEEWREATDLEARLSQSAS